MDLILCYLEEADDFISQMDDITLYESVFYESDEQTEKKNQELGEKSYNVLQKAWNAIKSMWQKMIAGFRNFMEYQRMNAEDKAKFKKFEQACREYPEFANMKVTVQNWKEIDKAYEATIKCAKTEVDRMTQADEDARPSFKKAFDSLFKKATGIAKTAVEEVTIGKLVQDAKKDSDKAYKIFKFLQNDYGQISIMEKELGEARVKKIKKKFERLSSKYRIVRWWAGARKQQLELHKHFTKGKMSAIEDAWHSFREKVFKAKKSMRTVTDPLRTTVGIINKTTDRNEDAKAIKKEVMRGVRGSIFQGFRAKRQNQRDAEAMGHSIDKAHEKREYAHNKMRQEYKNKKQREKEEKEKKEREKQEKEKAKQ